MNKPIIGLKPYDDLKNCICGIISINNFTKVYFFTKVPILSVSMLETKYKVRFVRKKKENPIKLQFC